MARGKLASSGIKRNKSEQTCIAIISLLSLLSAMSASTDSIDTVKRVRRNGDTDTLLRTLGYSEHGMHSVSLIHDCKNYMGNIYQSHESASAHSRRMIPAWVWDYSLMLGRCDGRPAHFPHMRCVSRHRVSPVWIIDVSPNYPSRKQN